MIRCAKQDALRSFSEGGPLYYVYLIESLSAQEERYVGMTTDLKQRLREHDQGKSSHTTKFSPWKLITYVAFTDRAKAEAFERYLKSGSGHAFARFVQGPPSQSSRGSRLKIFEPLTCRLELAVR
jgi:putative endonuclease